MNRASTVRRSFFSPRRRGLTPRGRDGKSSLSPNHHPPHPTPRSAAEFLDGDAPLADPSRRKEVRAPGDVFTKDIFRGAFNQKSRRVHGRCRIYIDTLGGGVGGHTLRNNIRSATTTTAPHKTRGSRVLRAVLSRYRRGRKSG